MDGLLSVIIPAYNEEAMVPRAASAIAGVLAAADIPFELLFVDDGSVDGTWGLIQAASAGDRRIRGISFSRNFGKDRAIFAGLSRALGACCAVIDCDLQHPPEALVEMYRRWQEGWQVVEGVKEDRGKESLLYRLCARTFYALITRTAGFDMRRSSDFRLLDRQVVDVLLAMPEQEAFFRALSTWVGFRRTSVAFSVRERAAGTSKWSTRALIRYAVSSILAFSDAPLLVPLWAGCLVLALAALGLVGYAVFGGSGTGWLLFLAWMGVAALGCVLVCLGVLGIYVARIHRQAMGRPRYIIAAECGVEG